jgi:hypothetical protein
VVVAAADLHVHVRAHVPVVLVHVQEEVDNGK